MLTRPLLDLEVSFFSGILDPQLVLWVQRKIWLLCFSFISVRQQNKSTCQSIFNEQLSLDFSIPSLLVLCILTRWYSLFKVQQSHILTSKQTCRDQSYKKEPNPYLSQKPEGFLFQTDRSTHNAVWFLYCWTRFGPFATFLGITAQPLDGSWIIHLALHFLPGPDTLAYFFYYNKRPLIPFESYNSRVTCLVLIKHSCQISL